MDPSQATMAEGKKRSEKDEAALLQLQKLQQWLGSVAGAGL